ncbi:hypothetical protein A1351_15510 [Methylosinus sp. R-45379]|uniref:hypothetical protein n=1 Tax=Methylosinus sp. R-45379 TaxID=980563 RepID=UPI0007C9747C|nr:hypothetical protein [Methylosinus sp. R-45379]OAI25958.1 hypothetical protein A1351_15510 [Methylosinus sp. R-45379]
MSDQSDAPENPAPISEAPPKRTFVVILGDAEAAGRRGAVVNLDGSAALTLIGNGAARLASADDLAIAYPAAIPEV